MVSDERDPAAKPPGAAPGRRPPTIDLKATEIASAPGPQADKAASQPDPAAGDTASSEPAASDTRASSDFNASTQEGRIGKGRGSRWPMIAGGVGGAALVSAISAAIWAGGFFNPAEIGDERFAQIEAQLRSLASRPASADKNALDAIAARLVKIETALSAAPTGDPALASRLANLDAALKTMAGDVAGLRGRLDEIAANAAAAQQRADSAMSAAEAAQKSSQSMSELARAAQSDDRAGRLAVAANALRTTAEREHPFAAELALAKSLAGNAQNLSALDAFAATGIPSAAALGRDLSALVPALVKASAARSEASFLERLQANAERLVRIRPVGDAAGDDPARVIARIEAKAAQADLDGALAELKKLSVTARAPAEAWIAAAERRAAALEASRQFARAALAALGKPVL